MVLSQQFGQFQKGIFLRYDCLIGRYLIMQIKSSCESMCVDFYEIKDVNGNIDTQNRLKVLTFMGETMKKGVINVWKMAEELDDYLQNYNYKVTINTKRPPQLVLKKEDYYVS